MGFATRLIARLCMGIAIAVVCAAAGAQTHPDAGAMVYRCDGEFWRLKPCGEGQQVTGTGRVLDNGMIESDTPPPTIDLRPEAERKHVEPEPVAEPPEITSRMKRGAALLIASKVLLGIAWIWLVVVAFSESFIWGVLALVPPIWVLALFKFRSRAKGAFVTALVGFVLMVIGTPMMTPT
jgi:hypothetical protein